MHRLTFHVPHTVHPTVEEPAAAEEGTPTVPNTAPAQLVNDAQPQAKYPSTYDEILEILSTSMDKIDLWEYENSESNEKGNAFESEPGQHLFTLQVQGEDAMRLQEKLQAIVAATNSKSGVENEEAKDKVQAALAN